MRGQNTSPSCRISTDSEKVIYRIRPIVFAVIVLVTPLAYTAQGLNDFLYGNDSMGASEGTQVY